MSFALKNLVIASAFMVAGSTLVEDATAGGCSAGGYGGYSSYGSYGNYNSGYCPNSYRPQGSSNYGVALPQFGFNYDACGHGLRVDYVAYGSVAYRLGLQCDDFILSLNGCPVRSTREWRQALNLAMCQGGNVILEVKKCSGPVVSMSVCFGAVIGGEQPIIGAGGPAGASSQAQTAVLNVPADPNQPAGMGQPVENGLPAPQIRGGGIQ